MNALAAFDLDTRALRSRISLPRVAGILTDLAKARPLLPRFLVAIWNTRRLPAGAVMVWAFVPRSIQWIGNC